MGKEQKQISDAYRSLFGLSPTTTQNEEESPEDKDRRLTKEIQDSEQRLQRLRDKRTSVLSYTSFHKRLKAVEHFLLTQELSPLLKGYQAGSFSKDNRERIRFMSAPEGELRIAFEYEPIFPVFQKAPKNPASILYFVDRPDPSRIYRLEIYEGERDAVSHLENVEWEIVREEETLSDLQRELSDNRIEALMADIPLPSDESQDTALSEIPAEELLEEKESERGKRADPESDGLSTEGGADHEVGEEKEEDTDAESISAPTVINGREEQGAETTATDGAKELDPAEPLVTLADIKAVLEAANKAGAGISQTELDADPKKRDELSGHRKRAVELWQQKQKEAKKISTKIALYTQAGKARKEFYAWSSGKRPDGSAADRDIRWALTSDWD